MSDQTAVSMETEVERAPAQNALAYAAIGGVRGKLMGGGEVYFSNNVKSAVKARAAGKVPQTFLTSEVNRAQQSIGYNAIAAALTHEVIPVAHVATRYAKAGKLEKFIAHLLENHAHELACALDTYQDRLLALMGEGPDIQVLEEEGTPEPTMEEDPGE